MHHSISDFLLHVWVGFLCIGTLKFSCCVGDAAVHCLERERQVLLDFKQGLKDPHNRLSSWVGDDCCKWSGIRCNNRTGHVVKLDLRNPHHSQISIRQYMQVVVGKEPLPEVRRCISGEINRSLLELKYLKHLDLSMNCFRGIGIPKFIGSFNNLRYLNLSRAGFGGMVPHELGNLSALRYLDLNHGLFRVAASPDVSIHFGLPAYNLHVDSLHWISHLSSLQHLDMGWVNLSMASDWLHPINMLPSLLNLQLRNCSLGSSPTSLSYVNFTSLSTLDLSDNMLGPRIPAWLFNISGMMSFNLGLNYFNDVIIPNELKNLCKLQNLDLSSNSFSGDIKRFKECFKGCIRSSLEDLNLRNNKLSGYLPNWFGQFTNLKYIDLSYNTLSGSIPPSLGRLSSLRVLDLSRNSFSGSIPRSLGRLSSLSILILVSNHLDGVLSHILVQLSNLTKLDVSHNSFDGVLSEAHFSNLKTLKYLSMSSTSIILNVTSNWVPPFQLMGIEMDNCKLGPQFPPWLGTQKKLHSLSFSNVSISDTIADFFWRSSPDIYSIDLSNNFISGPIIENVGETKPNLISLSLSSNRLKGSIHLSACKMKYLLDLNLSDNCLTDEIPQCLGALKHLAALSLKNNNLSGVIPSSISHLSRLESLHLNNNMLSGELPPAMKNCTRLVTLDLGENEFSGKIPKWIGEELSSLEFLILRYNKFDGILPPQLALLSNLRVLDLAQNNITGTIPTSFGNFSAMTIVNRTKETIYRGYIGSGLESITVSWKGGEYEYNTTISLLVNINLSGNDLCGEIPKEIFDLLGLQSLNLSHNHLTGKISENINGLRWIESLDLSWNQLSGEIPHSMSYLTSLSRLNLSYNNFSGRIPSGNQLDTIMDSSVVTGNPFLCGPPLLNQCPNDETSHDSKSVVDDEESRDLLMFLFYIGMALGFVVGFWIVCGTLLFKRSWRIAYYGFFDDMGDLLYATVARNVAKFQKK